MGFLGKKPLPETAQRNAGQLAEDRALQYALSRGWKLIERNYRTPGRGGGEIDLILRTGDGTVVFVEVRQRTHTGFGGAAGSIGAIKRKRVVLAARTWISHQRVTPACRFDAALWSGDALEWVEAAFDADG